LTFFLRKTATSQIQKDARAYGKTKENHHSAPPKRHQNLQNCQKVWAKLTEMYHQITKSLGEIDQKNPPERRHTWLETSLRRQGYPIAARSRPVNLRKATATRQFACATQHHLWEKPTIETDVRWKCRGEKSAPNWFRFFANALLRKLHPNFGPKKHPTV